MVSTMASGDTRPYVDIKDVTMMYSVVDISGINRLSSRILLMPQVPYVEWWRQKYLRILNPPKKRNLS